VSDGLFRRSIAELIPYEPGKPVEEVQRELGLDRVVKLASNEGPFPPFPAALEAIERAAHELNRYPDGGAYALRAALAERHGVALDEVVVGPGADAVIDWLSQATLDPGDEIVCGWPSFPSYVLDAAKLGAAAK
jgi:histidinol-phosphate aminotransferase